MPGSEDLSLETFICETIKESYNLATVSSMNSWCHFSSSSFFIFLYFLIFFQCLLNGKVNVIYSVICSCIKLWSLFDHKNPPFQVHWMKFYNAESQDLNLYSSRNCNFQPYKKTRENLGSACLWNSSYLSD